YIEQEQTRAVIVCSFTHEIIDLKKDIENKGFKCGVIKGGMKENEREENKIKFIKDEYKFIIIQSACSEGIDGLQENCNNIYFYSRNYSYLNNYQITARLFRKGLKKNLIITNFVSWIENSKTGKLKPTIDSAILKNLDEKRETADSLIKDTIKDYKEFYK
ncbi:MAG: helicase-related protein, partial [Promethearchaeia archaeon]